MNSSHHALLGSLLAVVTLVALLPLSVGAATLARLEDSVSKLEEELVAKYGEAQRSRIERGLKQVTDFWRPEDGDDAALEEFVRANFAGNQQTLDALFTRFERLLEALDGHMNELVITFREQSDLDRGPILPFDQAFAGYDPSAHVLDDFFANKLAFTVLLNFPLTTLEERLSEGESWSRRQWAETRLAQRFSKRIPAEVSQAVAEASATAGQYIAEYNIWMHHLLNEDGKRLFPPGQRLLAHWNLRDEIKGQYANAGGLARQRMIQRVMERIVDQTIPQVVIDNPHVDWNPMSNAVTAAAAQDSDRPAPSELEVDDAREPDTRYQVLLNNYLASRMVDPYSPTAPTLIERRFNEDRELPEARVRAMFEQVLSSPMLGEIARLIEKRLGRPLEPFDIWYDGFRPRGQYSEAELDKIVRERYPTAEAFEEDIPRMLVELGFPQERARMLADNILVQPARGSGHAWGAAMRSAKTRLRTRVGAGMDYKGYNIAVHEMGHNVEQTLSLNFVDHTLLQGVPNTAFTEALAFVFQNRDLELLGLAATDPRAEALNALDAFWSTAEIAAVGLVDMEVWHWMYQHPNATPAELRQATLQIARDIWNRYYAPVMGRRKDVTLLAIYSHMIHRRLYLPDYPIGHMIALQVEAQMKKAGSVGPEFERMAVMGSVVPDLWMKNATGAPVGPEALLAATEQALAELGPD